MAKMIGNGRTSRWTEDAPGSKIHWEAPGLRANAGMDEGFRHVAGLQEMGMEAARLIGENRGQPVDQVLSENAPRLRQASERGSAYSVFQDGPNTGFGGKISRLRSDLMNDPDWRKKVLGALIYGAVPFSRVPEVVWNTGLKRLPAVNELVGSAKIIQALRNGDRRGARLAGAETLLDSTINLAIAGEALAGNITGKDDPEHPWSLRLPGDKWVDYRATGPLGLRMGVIASAVEAKQEDANKLRPDWLAETLDKTGSLLSNQWYLDSIVGTLSLIREGRLTDAASQFLTQSGDRLLPAGGALNYIEQSTDPLMRDPTKELPGALFERQESRMPIPAVTEAIKGATGLDLTSAQLPARVSTTTGEPVQRGARGWLEAASGISEDVSDWGRKEIATLHRSGYTLNPPPEKVDSITVGGSEIPLNDAERRTYLQGRGEYIGKVAANLQQSASYRNASDNGKAEMWQKIMDNSADVGVK